jgi:hypothetical protein
MGGSAAAVVAPFAVTSFGAATRLRLRDAPSPAHLCSALAAESEPAVAGSNEISAGHFESSFAAAGSPFFSAAGSHAARGKRRRNRRLNRSAMSSSTSASSRARSALMRCVSISSRRSRRRAASIASSRRRGLDDSKDMAGQRAVFEEKQQLALLNERFCLNLSGV